MLAVLAMLLFVCWPNKQTNKQATSITDVLRRSQRISQQDKQACELAADTQIETELANLM